MDVKHFSKMDRDSFAHRLVQPSSIGLGLEPREQERVRINGKHCPSCRCTPMQDRPGLSRTDGRTYGEPLIIPDLERSSLLCHMTDGHWLGRASCPEVIDVDLNNSLDLGKSRFQYDIPYISSMGSLVCPTSAALALQPSKLLETEFSINETLSQNGLHRYTNQAQRRDGQPDIFEGLASTNQDPTQPCVSAEIVGPSALQLEDNGLGLPAVDDQASVIRSSSMSRYETYQPPTNLSNLLDEEGFINPFLAVQNSSFFDLGTTVEHESIPCVPSYSSRSPAISGSQSITGLQAFAEPIHDNETSLVPGQFNFPALLTDLSDWTTGGQLLIDLPLMSTPDQGGESFANTHAISPSPNHSTRRTKRRRPFRCPHDDCDYTSTTFRDVQRHLGSRKHGESPKTFPCLVAGCNSLKENSRRDNFIRHMETVHRQLVSRKKNGRRPKGAAQEAL